MRRIFVIVLCIILLIGCSVISSMRKPTQINNDVDMPSLNFGMNIEAINSERIVRSLDKGFPAELAGVKRGDVLVSISFGGKIISSSNEYESLRFKIKLGDYIQFVFNRDGRQIKFNIEPKWVKVLPTELKVYSILLDNKKVSMAIIVSEVKNTYKNIALDWAEATKTNLQSEYEMYLISRFGELNNFSIVDRARLKQILDELKFSQSGFVSDKLRTKIGEMTGATHIVDINFARYETRAGKEDIIYYRLIEIESGKVLVVDQVNVYE